ncbi:hypothetical protein GCM10025865_23960 [Paraoerskovia sediminicola]|uniref:Uncharacterized protein n=1 Tax=Paraoerskovia sediminicola TaxID=1138587 RepID=A0ABM8G4U1_9CELL|nr:hypothetical protein GCM10025865_23960 [Paraoerskovia sediminicola]
MWVWGIPTSSSGSDSTISAQTGFAASSATGTPIVGVQPATAVATARQVRPARPVRASAEREREGEAAGEERDVVRGVGEVVRFTSPR